MVFLPEVEILIGKEDTTVDEDNRAIHVYGRHGLRLTLVQQDIPTLKGWVKTLEEMSRKGSLVDEVV